MNRRNFIKSTPLLGFAPFVQAEEHPCPLECTLLPFQQEIWEAFNKYQNNLFIMPSKSGKTFMFNRLYEICQSVVGNFYFLDESSASATIVSRNENLEWRSNIFTTREGKERKYVTDLLEVGDYNVLEFSVEDIKPLT